MKYWIFTWIVALVLLSADFVKAQQPVSYVAPKFVELPLGSVKPQGWLLDQLHIMRKGTSGHLDEVYEKVQQSNGWLGGTGDGWEETPYWLDGAVPLAYLLDDKDLKVSANCIN
jgi:hypothetical protein